RVHPGDVAEVCVTGAGGHVDEAVVEERVVGSGEVEDPALPCRILAEDPPAVRPPPAGAKAGERAALGVEAGAAAVEEEHDLGRVGPALEEGELAAVGTLAVAAGNDLLPRRGTGDGRSRRRRDLRRSRGRPG